MQWVINIENKRIFARDMTFKIAIFTFILLTGLIMEPGFSKQRIDYHHPELATIYPQVKISPEIPRTLKHEQLVRKLHELKKRYPEFIKLEKVGQSVEGRELYLVTLGNGPRSVLMWSQMHGNEPTATNALLDIFNYLLQYHDTPFAQEILQGITLYALPMLNPDGAERFQRRNLQGLDINRDARDLATPEGRTLKAVRDRIQPEFGFNLHDQNARRTVGNTNQIVAIALLVPPFDENENDSPKRIEAKRVASVVYQALAPYIYGHIARYDANFMPRAFGDSMQQWGTRTVLIEAGGWYEDDPTFLVKLNFIAILEACHAIATGSYAHANPGLYDALPQNDKELFDLLISNATIIDDLHSHPFKGDIGINYTETGEGEKIAVHGRIADVGDLDVFAAKDTIDASRLLVMPGLIGLLSETESAQVPDEAVFKKYLKKGYTTLLVQHDFTESSTLEQRIARLQATPLPVNIGFVVSLSRLAKSKKSKAADQLGEALSHGALAVLANRPEARNDNSLTDKLIQWLKRPKVDPQDISAGKSLAELAREKQYCAMHCRAQELHLLQRGAIRIDDYADLVMYRWNGRDITTLSDNDLELVLVNGRPVYPGPTSEEKAASGLVLLP